MGQYISAYISLIISSKGLQCSYAMNLLMMSHLTLDSYFKVKLWQVSIKVPKSHLLVPEICNVQSTFRKPLAVNLLVMSHLALVLSFKVKLGRVRIKVPICRLALVLGVFNVESTFRKV